MQVISMPQTKVRLTVDLPEALVEQATEAVESGAARSRNQLIAQAIEVYLRQLQEAQIDAQFAEMADDKKYRELALQLNQEFERSDWEALQLGERKK
jgi:metal-responsive CopG/Arc/MetJ family transcriptional regulator